MFSQGDTDQSHKHKGAGTSRAVPTNVFTAIQHFQQPTCNLTHQLTSLGAAVLIEAGYRATYRCQKILPRYMHVEVIHAHGWGESPEVHSNWLGP